MHNKSKDNVVVTPGAVVVTFTEDQKKQAEECLKKSGHVKITFKEIKATTLPTTLDNGVLID